MYISMFLILVSFIFAYFNNQDHPVIIEESDYETEEEENITIESKESVVIKDTSKEEKFESHPVDDVSESSVVSLKT